MFSLEINRFASGHENSDFRVDLFSSVREFVSPMVGRLDTSSGNTATTFVVELNRAFQADNLRHAGPKELWDFCNAEDFDGSAIHVEELQDGRRIRIMRTSRTTTPLYVAETPDRIFASWDFWWIVDRLPRVSPNLDMCKRYIVEGPCLHNETVIEGVYLLLGGQSAVFDADRMILTEPTVSERFEPSYLRPNADVSLAFLDLIAESMRDVEHLNTCLELSGGYDSSCIAGACHRAGIKIPLSYGIIQGGLAGNQQIIRRSELINLVQISDVELQSDICRPFSWLAENPDARVVPHDELYRSATTACVKALPTLPDVVISGLGGDEITMDGASDSAATSGDGYDESLSRTALLLLGEVPDFLAEHCYGPMGTSALGSICRSDLFLNLGIWPKDPLAEPAIVRFAQFIPLSLKRDRMLNVLALARLGLSDYFILRRYRENFKVPYETDLRQFDIDSFFRGGFIESMAIASVAELSRQHEKFINSGYCDMPLMTFANAATLEFVLRRAHKRPSVN